MTLMINQTPTLRDGILGFTMVEVYHQVDLRFSKGRDLEIIHSSILWTSMVCNGCGGTSEPLVFALSWA